MSAIEQVIYNELIRLHAAIKVADGVVVSASVKALDDLLAANRPGLAPHLVHFLEGRSYPKALAWLGNGAGGFDRSASPGSCAKKGDGAL